MKWIGRAVFVVVLAMVCVTATWGQDTTGTGGGGGNPLQSFLAWINDPQWKLLLAFVGGQIMRMVPAVENKAIPFVLQSVNLVTVVFGALFGVTFQTGPVTAMIGNIDPQMGEVVTMGLLGSLSLGAVLDALATVALASGVQSQVKNAAQWWRMGRTIIKSS